MDVRRVGRLVSQAVGQPLSDVTRRMRTSRGFIAINLDAVVAVELAEKVERQLKQEILVIPAASCVPLPPIMRIRRLTVDAQGVRCEAYTWDETENIQAQWDNVFLVSCGRIEIQQSVLQREESNQSSNVSSGSYQVAAPRHEYLLDLVLHNPWRRLRLDQNTAGFSLTEMDQDPEISLRTIYRSAASLWRLANGVPKNRGVMLLARSGSDMEWAEFTFLNKSDFESYTYWLIQLVRYGRPISA